MSLLLILLDQKVVGEGNTFEEPLTDIKSTVLFQIETFEMDDILLNELWVIEQFIAEM